MYDNDQYNSGYPYSHLPARQGGDPWNQSRQPLMPPRRPKKKKGGVGRAVALVLCCALVGGGAGVGGAALYNTVIAPPTADADAPAVVSSQPDGRENDNAVSPRDDTDPTTVPVSQTNGLTPMSLSEINAVYADSCVCVSVQATAWYGYYQYETSAAGSGFIIREDGYIVTNYHVIDGATDIKVTLNNDETYDARLIGGEELNDVAVLKIDGISGLKPVVIGDSDDLVVGETVCTIGNALGTLSFSMTHGVVSSIGRSITMNDGTVMYNMIQTDCTINSGNSGGPLFDSYGRVAGITSAKMTNNGSTDAAIENIGFAIPINDVIGIITDYMEVGYVTGRPNMGITGQTIDANDVQRFGWPYGVMVVNIEEGSAAQRAGLRLNDIITKVDDTDITDIQQLISVKNSYRAGDTVTITVYRSGEYLTVRLTFDEQGSSAQGAQDPSPQPTDDPYGGNGPYGGFPWDDFFP